MLEPLRRLFSRTIDRDAPPREPATDATTDARRERMRTSVRLAGARALDHAHAALTSDEPARRMAGLFVLAELGAQRIAIPGDLVATLAQTRVELGATTPPAIHAALDRLTSELDQTLEPARASWSRERPAPIALDAGRVPRPSASVG